jgi:hypothetical protein
VGLGLTLKLSLAAENHEKINEETWKKAIAAHPEFSPHYEAAKGKFLEGAMRRLAASEELAHLKWLLERRHSDLFGRPPEQSVCVTNNVSVELPADVLERAREYSQASTQGPKDPKTQGDKHGPA